MSQARIGSMLVSSPFFSMGLDIHVIQKFLNFFCISLIVGKALLFNKCDLLVLSSHSCSSVEPIALKVVRNSGENAIFPLSPSSIGSKFVRRPFSFIIFRMFHLFSQS